jgi:hypothetical protein
MNSISLPVRLAVILSFLFSWVALNAGTADTTKKTLPTFKPIMVEPTFKDGEELNYVLHYGFVNGGYGYFSLQQMHFGGRDVFHAVAKGKTTGLTDKVFKVLDIYESYFDVSSNLPSMSIRNISEGNYRYYDEIIHSNIERKVKSKKAGDVKVPDYTLDMVSALYYIRRIDFSKFKGGEIVSVNTFFSGELFPFYIVFKNRETVKIGSGTYKCLKFVPIVEPGRIFKENDDMTIWLTDDENKIPIQIKFDMIVGSFKCDLVSYKNLKYDLKARIK